MKLFDSHAHLNDSQFDNDREELAALLPRKDVAFTVDVACDFTEAEISLALSQNHRNIYSALGFHPQNADKVRQEDYSKLEKLLAGSRVVALGEIGLDYHYDDGPAHQIQKEVFEAQLCLAESMGLPVIIHDREAHGDVMDLLQAHKGLKGIMHCYSGSYEMARQYIEMGLYISFAGPLTFDNARKQQEVAQRLPLEKLLIETDCPYLAPVPYRGRRNDPSLLLYTAKKLAELKKLDLDEIAERTTQNALTLFRIKTD